MFRLRNPVAAGVVGELSDRATARSPGEAAATGEVIVFAGPLGAWPGFAGAEAGSLAGKVVTDAANPYPARDGAMAQAITDTGKGSGAYIAGLIPESRVVKAFNMPTAGFQTKAAGRSGADRVVLFISGDDRDAETVVARLIRNASFAGSGSELVPQAGEED